MITSREELNQYLSADSANFHSQTMGGARRLKNNLCCTPASDQKYIWEYIVALRHVEWCLNTKGLWRHKFMRLYWLRKLRRIGYKTGFQIPPNVCGKGLTIWHWGPIIINQNVQIGENVTLYPGVLIGWKNLNEPCPIIGNNVFIGSGAKIIGDVHIGDNVIIGQNCVITKTIEPNRVVVSSENRILY